MEAESLNAFGVEIECAVDPVWRDDPQTSHPIMFRATRDGSINSGEGSCVEYITDPIEICRFDEFVSQTEELYEHIWDINSSMGLHIHISANEEDGYSLDLIKSYRFYEYFMGHVYNSELYENNTTFQNRMEENGYARDMDEDDIARSSAYRGDRYRRINFHALRSHGTVEFRLFPAMETAEEVAEAVSMVCTLTDEWIQDERFEFTNSVEAEVEAGEKVVTV